MIWQNAVLFAIGGASAHALYARDVIRRRQGKTVREAVLPKRREAAKVPSVTEVA